MKEKTIPEILKQLAALAGINDYNEETAVDDMRTQSNGHELYISKVCDDNAAYTLLLEFEYKTKKIYCLKATIQRNEKPTRMKRIDEVFTELAKLAGINDYDYDKAENDIIHLGNGKMSMSVSGVKSDDIAYKLYSEHNSGCVYSLGCNINRK